MGKIQMHPWVLAACIFFTPCMVTVANPPPGSDHEMTTALLRVVDEPNQNRFFSPFSIRSALAMTSLGAEGKTLQQMNAVLGFESPGDAEALGRLGTRLVSSLKNSDTTLSIANRLWIDRDFPILESFKSACLADFGAQADSADFSNAPDRARVEINQWVSDQTHGKIEELFPAGLIDSQTRLVLANAIYFKADWMHPFSPDATGDGAFKPLDKPPSPARLMNQKTQFPYGEDDEFQVLEMPYRDGNLSMAVLLPKNPASIPAPGSWLTDPKKWAALEPTLVAVTLPKFTIRDRMDLTDPLKQLGMRDAFDAGAADFRRMSAGGELFISAVVHEAFIEVNESGTEAAAATGVAVAMRMAPKEDPVIFQADRPFWFLIRDMDSGVVVFAGRLSHL